jgi:hypothetical protein
MFVLVTLIGLLSACTLPLTTATPNPVSDSDMATRVAKILTEMPTTTSAIPTGDLPPLLTSTPLVSIATPDEQQPTEIPATATPQPTATQTPQAPTATSTATVYPGFTPPPDNPRAKLGSANWTDTMDDGDNWPTGFDKFTSINFSDGKLKLTGLTTTDGWRLALTEELSNVYLEMTVSTGECSGSDRYGFFFRVPNSFEANRGYLFGISCDGSYSLREWDATAGSKGVMTTHVVWTNSSAIQAGSNKTNTIGVMAVGDKLVLYANGVLLDEVKDSTFSAGSFGVFIGARETSNFTIAIDEINYWKNPSQ